MFFKNEVFHPYQIQTCTELSGSIFEIHFIPLDTAIAHQPGQVCKIHCRDGKGRFYSIVNHPSRKTGIVIHLRFTEKTTPAIAQLKEENTIVNISGPYGKIHSVLGKAKTRILYAEGLGISAFNSLIDDKKIDDHETHLIWIKDKIDDSYSKSMLEKWVNNQNSLKVSLFDKEQTAQSFNYCGDVFQKDKRVVMAFAGSPKTSNYIKNELLSQYLGDSVEYVSDV